MNTTMSKLDGQIPALFLSVMNVCITCWQLHFDCDLCLCVKSHKLSFWVPVLAAGVKFNFWLYLKWCFPVRSFWIGIGCNYGSLVHLNYRALFCAIKSRRVGRQSRSCYDYAHQYFCKLCVLYVLLSDFWWCCDFALSEAQMKQVMLSESIENILGFSRKRVIAICDNIVGIITRYRGSSYNNINVGQESASFLDFKIFGRNNASVCCHSTILMLSLPLMRHLICEESCLVLPDFSLEELKAFIKLLYGGGNRSKQLMVICPVWI